MPGFHMSLTCISHPNHVSNRLAPWTTTRPVPLGPRGAPVWHVATCTRRVIQIRTKWVFMCMSAVGAAPCPCALGSNMSGLWPGVLVPWSNRCQNRNLRPNLLPEPTGLVGPCSQTAASAASTRGKGRMLAVPGADGRSSGWWWLGYEDLASNMQFSTLSDISNILVNRFFT